MVIHSDQAVSQTVVLEMGLQHFACAFRTSALANPQKMPVRRRRAPDSARLLALDRSGFRVMRTATKSTVFTYQRSAQAVAALLSVHPDQAR